MYSSDRATFLESAANGANFIPLVKSWPADLETPVTTWLKVGYGQPPGVLLESIEGGERIGRWSVVASDPLWIATASGNNLRRVWRDGCVDDLRGNPFEVLRNFLSPYKPSKLNGLPSLGQLYGIWGYELIKWIEPSVSTHESSSELIPDGIWMMMDSILIFDQVKRIISAVSYVDLTRGDSVDIAYEDAINRLQKLEEKMTTSLINIKPLKWNLNQGTAINTKSNFTRADFEAAVELAKKNIANGDIFQLVLSQKLETQVEQEPFDLYRSLRMVNPSPYMAFFDFGDWQLIGSSPEVMVKAEPLPGNKGVKASLRPIAGTRQRGKTDEEDLQLEKELLSDPKERAEHVMLVDLGRNDLGRVCRAGSVLVKELMVIERYSHVMHIVSEVEGLLMEKMDVWDLLMASFPAGTVSGAPKIRAMQLINQLEKESRGPYSGVYGSMDLNGALNTAITIRTMVVRKNSNGGSVVQVQAGAGVVADSIASSEFQETLNKAQGILTSIACLEAQKL